MKTFTRISYFVRAYPAAFMPFLLALIASFALQYEREHTDPPITFQPPAPIELASRLFADQPSAIQNSAQANESLPKGALHRFGTTRLKHSDHILAVTHSHRGNLLATASLDKTVRIWQTQSGAELCSIPLLGDSLAVSLAFTNNDKQLVIAGSLDKDTRAHSIIVANTKTGEVVKTLLSAAQGDTITCLTLSHKHTMLAASASSGKIRFWRADKWDSLPDLDNAAGAFLSICFSPDDSIIAGAGSDNSVRFWDLDTGKQQTCHTKHQKPVDHLTFTDDGNNIITSDAGGTLMVFDRTRAEVTQAKKLKQGALAYLSIADGGKELLCGIPPKTWMILSLPNLTVTASVTDESASFGTFSLSPTRTRLLTAASNRDYAVREWDLRSRKECNLSLGHLNPVVRAGFDKSGRIAVSADTSGCVMKWDCKTGLERSSYRNTDKWVSYFAIDNHGNLIARWSDRDHPIEVLDMAAKELLTTIDCNARDVDVLSFSPNGKILMAAFRDVETQETAIEIWDLAAKCKTAVIPTNQTNQITSLQMSPSGAYVAWTDKALHCWDLAKDSQIALEQTLKRPTAVVFSPTDCYLGASDASAGFGTWEISSGKALNQYPKLRLATFAPFNRVIAGADKAGNIVLVNMESGKEILSLAGHVGTVRVLCFSTGGDLLLTGSTDTTLLLWKLADQCLVAANCRSDVSDESITQLWKDMESNSPLVALGALHRLAPKGDKIVDLVEKHFRGYRPKTRAQVAALIKSLDDDNYGVREEASKALLEAGPDIAGMLAGALRNQPTAEQRGRLVAILDKLRSEPPNHGSICRTRMLVLLSMIDTKQASALLRRIAEGPDYAPEVRLAAYLRDNTATHLERQK